MGVNMISASVTMHKWGHTFFAKKRFPACQGGILGLEGEWGK